MNVNPPGEPRKETVSQGGGASVSLSGGDERSEPESLIQFPCCASVHNGEPIKQDGKPQRES